MDTNRNLCVYYIKYKFYNYIHYDINLIHDLLKLESLQLIMGNRYYQSLSF